MSEEQVWMPDPQWQVVDDPDNLLMLPRCRSRGCPNRVVAVVYRKRCFRGRISGVPWHYCADHLYARRIRDGVVEVLVHRTNSR